MLLSGDSGPFAWFVPFLLWVLVIGSLAVLVVFAVAAAERRRFPRGQFASRERAPVPWSINAQNDNSVPSAIHAGTNFRPGRRLTGDMGTAVAEALMTPAQVADLFRVDPKTVTRWAKVEKLTSIRTLGGHRRYRETEVRALLASIPQRRSE